MGVGTLFFSRDNLDWGIMGLTVSRSLHKKDNYSEDKTKIKTTLNSKSLKKCSTSNQSESKPKGWRIMNAFIEIRGRWRDHG